MTGFVVCVGDTDTWGKVVCGQGAVWGAVTVRGSGEEGQRWCANKNFETGGSPVVPNPVFRISSRACPKLPRRLCRDGGGGCGGGLTGVRDTTVTILARDL